MKMKLHKRHIPHYLFLALLFMMTNAASGQTGDSKNTADSAITKIVKKLSVTKEKAKQIQAAYAYNRNEIAKLEKDSTFKGPGKPRLLKKLQTERKQKIDSTVTPAQKSAMIADQNDLYKKQMAKREEMMKRHEAEMNRIPHKRILKTTQADTTKKKVKTN